MPTPTLTGHAIATSSMLNQPLSGNVYLRSSSHNLPDLVVSLGGQIQVDLVGRVDSTNLCNATHRAQVQFNAHNGKTYDTTPKVRADCGKKKRGAGKKKGGGEAY